MDETEALALIRELAEADAGLRHYGNERRRAAGEPVEPVQPAQPIDNAVRATAIALRVQGLSLRSIPTADLRRYITNFLEAYEAERRRSRAVAPGGDSHAHETRHSLQEPGDGAQES